MKSATNGIKMCPTKVRLSLSGRVAITYPETIAMPIMEKNVMIQMIRKMRYRNGMNSFAAMDSDAEVIAGSDCVFAYDGMRGSEDVDVSSELLLSFSYIPAYPIL